MKWGITDIPDLNGKIAIVTGANSGLGFQESLALAKKGATVILAVRSREKGMEAAAKIQQVTSNPNIIPMKLDLANIETIKFFADSYLEEFERLDLLINNAGVMAIPFTRTKQGFEMQFGTNHLGHFVLTALLIDILDRTHNARIVNVSSYMHKFGNINFDDLNREKSYSRWGAYGQSKLANLLFTIELERRLKLAGKNTLVAAAHPGWARTNLQARRAEIVGSKTGKFIADMSNRLFAQSAFDGALPIIYAATSPAAVSGCYYGPGGFMSMRGDPVEEKPDSRKVNPNDAVRLWEVSEQMTGIQFKI